MIFGSQITFIQMLYALKNVEIKKFIVKAKNQADMLNNICCIHIHLKNVYIIRMEQLPLSAKHLIALNNIPLLL